MADSDNLKATKFMGTYEKCPSCGNIKKGDIVYMCAKCRYVWCEACKTSGATCPSCGYSNWKFMEPKKLGKIKE